MLKRSIPFTLLILLTTTLLPAQDYLWERRYGGEKTEAAFTVIRTDDGGFLLAGSTNSFTGGPRANTSGYVVKTDSLGQVMWERAIGTAEVTWVFATHQMPDGGYLVIGDHGGRSAKPVQIARLDDDGSIMWQRSFGTDSIVHPDDFYSISAATSSSGYGFLLAGISRGGKVAYWKIDSSGILIWRKSYEGVPPDPEFTQVEEYASGIQELPDGGVIVTGRTNATEGGDFDVYAMRLSPNGDSLWRQQYSPVETEGMSNDYGNHVIRLDDGKFIIVGQIYGIVPANDSRAYVIITDSNGIRIRDYLVTRLDWGFNGNETWLTSIARTVDGRYIAVGAIHDIWKGTQVLLATIDAEGNLIRTVGAGKIGDRPVGLDVVSLPGSRFAVTGYTQHGGGIGDAFLMMTGPLPPSDAPAVEDLPAEMDLSDLHRDTRER